MLSSVEKRTAFALPVFKIERFACVIPILSASIGVPLEVMLIGLPHQFFHSLFHVLVPKAIDKRVQHGDDYCIDDSDHTVLHH